MSAIDLHTHAFPDEIAPRAMTKLQEQCHAEAVGDGTIRGLLESMNAADIDVSVVCAIATKPGQSEGILKWCRTIRGQRIEPFPSVHPDDPEAGRWLARIAEDRFAGIKLHPQHQSCAADDPRMDAIYEAAAASGLLVASHSGRDLWCGPDDDRASPERFARVLQRHPNLRLLCTHMGGWRWWDEVERHLLGKDVYLETSFSLEELGPRRAADMIRRHGVHRVMMGSDWPWRPQAAEIPLVGALGLTEEQTKAILWSNAAKLLGY